MEEGRPVGSGTDRGGLVQEKAGDAASTGESREPDFGEPPLADFDFPTPSGPPVQPVTWVTITIVSVFTVCAIVLFAVTYLEDFRELLDSAAFFWTLRFGLGVMILTFSLYLVLGERAYFRYYQRLYSETRRANRRLGLLLKAGGEVGSTLDVEEILMMMLDYVAAETGSEVGAVYLWDREKDALRLALVRGVDENKMMFKELPVGRGLIGSAAGRRETVVIDDTGSLDERDNVFFGAARLGSQVVVPLEARGRFVGMLVAGTRGKHTYTREEELLLRGFAELVSLAVANAELYRIARKSLDMAGQQRGVMESVLQQMMAGVVTANSSGRIDMFNAEAERITGYSFAERKQMRLSRGLSPEENPLGPLETEMLEVLENPVSVREGEAEILRKDGERVGIGFRVYPLSDGRDTLGVAAIFTPSGGDRTGD